jgi:hypothetical protein
MSVALARQIMRQDGTLSEKVVSLAQYRQVDSAWCRVVVECIAAMNDTQRATVAAAITAPGDTMLLREALAEYHRAIAHQQEE